MRALIFRPAKTTMQSGHGGRQWRVEFDQAAARRVEPLMGWTGSSDMRQELDLCFDSKEDAVTYCERNGIDYRVAEPQRRRPRARLYADNFSHKSSRGPGTEPL
jgi:hypothetical protein